MRAGAVVGAALAAATLAGTFAVAGDALADARADDSAMGRKLQGVLKAHGADVHGCYGVALAERAGISGEVLLRMWVQPDGSVGRVDLLKDQTNSGRLDDCLTDAIRHWRVPELAGADTQQIVFPLAFHPDDATTSHATSPAQPATVGKALVVHLADGKPGALPGNRMDARVLVDPSTVGATQASLTRLDLRASQRLALHRHPGTLEILYVVRGRAHIRNAFVAGSEDAETGDLIVAPADAIHNIEAAPLSPLELVQIFAPAGPEQAYRNPRDPAARASTLPGKKEKLAGDAAPDPARVPKIIHARDLKPYSILSGHAQATLFLDGYADARAAVQRFEADAGAQVPPHLHPTSDELFYVLAGKGRMSVAGEQFAVAAGDAIHIPQGALHSLTVTEKLVAVQCYAPAGPEQRFKTASPGPASSSSPASPSPSPSPAPTEPKR